MFFVHFNVHFTRFFTCQWKVSLWVVSFPGRSFTRKYGLLCYPWFLCWTVEKRLSPLIKVKFSWLMDWIFSGEFHFLSIFIDFSFSETLLFPILWIKKKIFFSLKLRFKSTNLVFILHSYWCRFWICSVWHADVIILLPLVKLLNIFGTWYVNYIEKGLKYFKRKTTKSNKTRRWNKNREPENAFLCHQFSLRLPHNSHRLPFLTGFIKILLVSGFHKQ